jgi:hypothetical protein
MKVEKLTTGFGSEVTYVNLNTKQRFFSLKQSKDQTGLGGKWAVDHVKWLWRKKEPTNLANNRG